MSTSLFSGPSVVAGPLFGIPGSSSPESVDFGPSITYQGDAFPDVRFNINKDNITPGSVRSYLSYPYVLAVDAVPAALAANNIVAAAAPASGVAMTLAGKSTGIATAVPFTQLSTGTVITSNITLDYGFQTANCTAGTATVTVQDSTKFVVGMPLVIANVGNAGGTTALQTYVQSIPSATTITLYNAPLATNAAAPVGTGNYWGYLSGVPPVSSFNLAYQPFVAAGSALLWDPTQGISRGVRVVGASLVTGGTVTISGYDMYGAPQTQTLTMATGSTTQWSTKTFKHITSVVPAFTDTGTLSVGTSDVFGLNIRNDKWEYDNFYWAGAFLTASTGWTAAVTTSPATATTGDVRGTIQLGTNGPLGSGASGGASNGTLRLALFSTIPQWNVVAATANNSVPMFGVTPA